jgi:hypothetical protein
MKDIGWNGFSVDTALAPLGNMGQEPVRSAGRGRGPREVVVLHRFDAGAHELVSTLAANQRFNLAAAARGRTPQRPMRC